MGTNQGNELVGGMLNKNYQMSQTVARGQEENGNLKSSIKDTPCFNAYMQKQTVRNKKGN